MSAHEGQPPAPGERRAKTGARTGARVAALQMLFAADLAGTSAEQLLRDFWREFPGDPEDRAYADTMTRGVLGSKSELDERIEQASDRWRLERMTPVARNILRLGLWELAHSPEVPLAVVIDEAVELSKSFGTKETHAFVNGILNRLGQELRGQG